MLGVSRLKLTHQLSSVSLVSSISPSLLKSPALEIHYPFLASGLTCLPVLVKKLGGTVRVH